MDCVFQYTSFSGVYLDDVVMFSESLDGHGDHLIYLFELIAKNGLKLTISKCSFVNAQTKLLGHVIGKEVITVDQEMTTIRRSTPEPRKKTKLRRFLGLQGYY